MLGTTSVICLVLAYLFNLNIVATQIANLVVTPLDIALFLPFIQAGDAVFGASFPPGTDVFSALKNDFWGFLGSFWVSLLHGFAAWGMYWLYIKHL